MAFEKGAGVLEVLFGVGFGSGEARKRFVEDGDDALLFGQRGERNLQRENLFARDARNCSACGQRLEVVERRTENRVNETWFSARDADGHQLTANRDFVFVEQIDFANPRAFHRDEHIAALGFNLRMLRPLRDDRIGWSEIGRPG